MEKNKGILIKSHEQYDFVLLKDKSGRGKNLLYYNVFNPKTGKNQRQRCSINLTGNLSDKQLLRNAQDLADALIIQLKKTSFNPVTGTFSDVQLLTPSNTIKECADNYLTYRKKKYEAGAITKTRIDKSNTVIKHFIDWLATEKYLYRKPGSFNEIDIEGFFNDKTSQLKWGKETWNDYRDNLKSFFIYLIKLKIIADNPVTGIEVKNTKYDSTIFKIYTEEELNHVANTLYNSPEYFSLLVAAKLLSKYSVRLEEQLTLQIKDYDSTNSLLTIPTSKTKNGNEAIFHFDDEMNELIIKLIGDNNPSDYYIFGDRNKPSKARLANGYLGQRWRKFRAKYNINSDLKLYALKHSSAYYAKEDGESLEALSERLRHSDIKTTRRYSDNRLNKKPIKAVSNSRF
jgi:integrase